MNPFEYSIGSLFKTISSFNDPGNYLKKSYYWYADVCLVFQYAAIKYRPYPKIIKDL